MSIVAQDDDAINQMVDGKKNGLWRTRQKNGKTQEGSYIAGRKDGEWKTTRADGTTESIVTFSNGVARGRAIYFYSDGKTIMEEGIWNIDHWEG